MTNEIESRWISKNTLVFFRNNREIARWNYREGKIVSREGNLINGSIKRYYENGYLMAEEYYIDSKENGISKTYNENGILESTQTYKDDMLDGTTTWYNEDETIEKVECYKNGELIETSAIKNELKEDEIVTVERERFCPNCGKKIETGDTTCKNCYHEVEETRNNESQDGKYDLTFYLGGFGALAGAIIGEFFPSLLASGFYDSLGGSMSESFSGYRNGLALKYAIFGLIIGAVIGLLITIAKKNSNENK